MTTEVHELPEVGEIVVATIAKIGDHGAYASLDEYNNIQGFLHASEVAHGWVRNINKFVKEGEKKVLLVKRIRAGRAEIDLSLKQVSREQRKNKLLDVKLFQKGKGIIKNVQEKTKLSDDDIEKLEDKILSKYDSVYDGVVDIARNGIKVFSDLKLAKRFLDMLKNGAIEETKKYIESGLSSHTLHTSNSIIGLNEIGLFLDKKISVKELKEKVLIKTRQYAKRQRTWQRGQMQDWKGFVDVNYLDLLKKVLSYLSKT